MEPNTCDRCGRELQRSYSAEQVVANRQVHQVADDGRTLFAGVVGAFRACSWGCAAVLAACLAAKHEAHPDAAVLVVAERERQVNAEGWEPGHDDAYEPGVLARAGVGYAWDHAAQPGSTEHAIRWPSGRRAEYAPECWPLPDEWWKPKDELRDLVRAGALVAAEADRTVRARRADRAVL